MPVERTMRFGCAVEGIQRRDVYMKWSRFDQAVQPLIELGRRASVVALHFEAASAVRLGLNTVRIRDAPAIAESFRRIGHPIRAGSKECRINAVRSEPRRGRPDVVTVPVDDGVSAKRIGERYTVLA